MARDALTRDPTGVRIAAYLADVDRRLVGPQRARADVRAEIHDGLLAATDRRLAGGAAPDAAVRLALAEFGPPELVARAFSGELATAQARRLLTQLLLTGPVVGMWWLLLLAPHRWPPRPGELVAAIPVLPVVAATIAAALVVLAATGPLGRRMPEFGPGRVVAAARAVTTTCLAVDVGMLTLLVTIAVAAPTARQPALMAAAAAASLMRLAWAGRAASRCRSALRPS